MGVMRRVELYCNACYDDYTPPVDADYSARHSVAGLRRLAKKDGWTFVRSPYAMGLDEDYCPRHRPEDASSQ